MAGDVVALAPSDPEAHISRPPTNEDMPALTDADVRRYERYKSPWRKLLPKWTIPKAHLVILTAAMTADAEADPRESKALESIAARSIALRRLSMNAVEALHEDVHKQLGLDKWSPEPQPDKIKHLTKLRRKALERATRCFYQSPNLRRAVYLQAIDILRADQTLLTSERVFYRELAAMLAMTPDEVSACREMIEAKNKH